MLMEYWFTGKYIHVNIRNVSHYHTNIHHAMFVSLRYVKWMSWRKEFLMVPPLDFSNYFQISDVKGFIFKGLI